jgi:hypothetical protein
MNIFGRRKTAHKFRRVSKRGRAAYLILCFEECLSFYGEDIGDWKWILEELWAITSTWDIERWVKRVCDLTPESVLPYVSYQEMLEKVKERGYWYELGEENFVSLQSLYRKERPGFQVISSMVDRIYGVIVDDWGDSEEPFTLSCLYNIDEAEELMRCSGIPLPSDSTAMDFIMKHRDKHYGKPFEGVQFSAIAK